MIAARGNELNMALLGHRGLLTRLRSLKRGRFVCYSCAMHRVSGRRKRSSVRLSVGQAAGGGPPPPLTQSRLPVPSSRLSTVAVPQSKFSAARRTTGTFGSSTGVRLVLNSGAEHALFNKYAINKCLSL